MTTIDRLGAFAPNARVTFVSSHDVVEEFRRAHEVCTACPEVAESERCQRVADALGRCVVDAQFDVENERSIGRPVQLLRDKSDVRREIAAVANHMGKSCARLRASERITPGL